MIKSTLGIGRDLDAVRCVSEAVEGFRNPKVIIFFSGEKHFRDYARLINETFPKTICIGCSAYRMWSAEGADKELLKAVAIEDGVTCSAGVIEKADKFALEYADRIKRSVAEIGDAKNTLCVEFTVPYKRTEEYALMALNSVLLRHEIPIIGGTAANSTADKADSEEAYVSLNGEIYPAGCVYVLLHSTEGNFILRREVIYEPLTGRGHTVTKANDITRTVMTYDDKPAAEVYAEELNIMPEDINKYFFHFPVGRREGNEFFITAIQGEGSHGSLKHHARVYEGTEMMVMKEGDFRAINDRTLKEIKEKIPNPSLVLLFHCVAATALFEEKDYLDEFCQKLAKTFPNFIGFSCLGEQLGTKHFNHTMLLAVFE